MSRFDVGFEIEFKDKDEYDEISRGIKHWNNLENLQIISKAEIIGMTTTGAAKNHNLLRMLDPKFMIIEEAGQVLEAHILASLTPNLQQLGMLSLFRNKRFALAAQRNVPVKRFKICYILCIRKPM